MNRPACIKSDTYIEENKEVIIFYNLPLNYSILIQIIFLFINCGNGNLSTRESRQSSKRKYDCFLLLLPGAYSVNALLLLTRQVMFIFLFLCPIPSSLPNILGIWVQVLNCSWAWSPFLSLYLICTCICQSGLSLT